MQRWILAGLLLAVLGLAGAWFARQKYRENRPHPVWVPLPINPELPPEKRDEVIKDLKEKLSERELLKKVSQDIKLPQKWNFTSDSEAAEDIAARLFVRAGDADTPKGKVPAIHIGVRGKSKEQKVSGEIAVRLMDDVWGILGVPPPKKPEP